MGETQTKKKAYETKIKNVGKPVKSTKNNLLYCYKKWENSKNLQGDHEKGRNIHP